MSYATERAFAEAGYVDLREPRAPYIPVTQAEADRIAAEHARDNAERQQRAAEGVVSHRAWKRSACTTDHARELQEWAKRLDKLMRAARADGFEVIHFAEITTLALEAAYSLRRQQELSA